MAEKCPHHIQVVNKYIYKKNGKNRHHHKTLHSSIKYVATCKCRTRCQQTLHSCLHGLHAQTLRLKTVLKSTYWLWTGVNWQLPTLWPFLQEGGEAFVFLPKSWSELVVFLCKNTCSAISRRQRGNNLLNAPLHWEFPQDVISSNDPPPPKSSDTIAAHSINSWENLWTRTPKRYDRL